MNTGADPNAPAASDLRPVHVASQAGRLECLHLLLAVGVDPATPCTLGTPLHCLRAHNALPCAQALVAAGVPVDTPDAQGRTALWLHSTAGAGAVVQALLQCGADPGCTGPGGATPLRAACSAGAVRTVSALLQHRAGLLESPVSAFESQCSDPDLGRDLTPKAQTLTAVPRSPKPSPSSSGPGPVPDGDPHLRALLWGPHWASLRHAIVEDRVADLQALVAQGWAPLVCDPSGQSALSFAVACRREGAVRVLLDAGLDPNAACTAGYASIPDPCRPLALGCPPITHIGGGHHGPMARVVVVVWVVGGGGGVHRKERWEEKPGGCSHQGWVSMRVGTSAASLFVIQICLLVVGTKE